LLELQNLKQLLLFGVVARCLDQRSEEDSKVNGNRSVIVRFITVLVVHESDTKLEGGSAEQDNDVLVLELVNPDVEEALNQW